MRLTSSSFKERGPIPQEFAFAVPDPKAHIALGKNRNPHLTWNDVPPLRKSLVLIFHDPDVPARLEDVNKEGQWISASMPRTSFFHWLLLDIPPSMRDIAAGSQSDGVVHHGKPGPEAPGGLRHGLNDFTNFLAGDPQMRGQYYGYDGPAPPWNDERAHRYVFTLYAVDTPSLKVRGPLNGAGVMEALDGHVLARASLSGIYSLNA